jgi:hypothetical protein|tara:strand:+ start:312 stop:575 length:264 start_codon:yes stop_codon:yes gene_type:complete
LVPSGGTFTDGSGLSLVDGKGLIGAILVDGKSSLLSHICFVLQFCPKSSQTQELRHFASAVADKPKAISMIAVNTRFFILFSSHPVN